ncbi:hypothetical protein BGX28_008136 [Mortierella sp. GBA30]|nr:hypothetical protein BGX28_008136 [Mortierella sp. GBA30]
MSTFTSSSLSPFLSPGASCPPASSSSRSPFRKAGGGQHPLANVSTFDSDQEISTVNPENSSFNDTLSIERQEYTFPHQSALSKEASQASTSAKKSSSMEANKDGQTAQKVPVLMDNKQQTLCTVKNAVRAGSPRPLIITSKSGMSERNDTNAQEQMDVRHSGTNHVNEEAAAESDWASVAVATDVDQPHSPLTALHPMIVNQQTVNSGNTQNGASVTEPIDIPQPVRLSESAETVASPPSPRRDFEKWTPPPSTSRASQDPQREHQTLRQPHSRLNLPRLLKQRSLNFALSSLSSSCTSSSPSSVQQDIPMTRSSIDGILGRPLMASTTADNQLPTRTATSCDLPRPIGPPDPIPPYYQHLQNRHNRRRRSHGGELERFSPGWIVAENAAAAATASVSDLWPLRLVVTDEPQEASQRRRHATTPPTRRHASLGMQPNLSSMWERLLTSIFPSGPGGDSGEGEQRDTHGLSSRELSSQQQRLLLTPLSQQQQVHPLYQQQLFLYADEVVGAAERAESEVEEIAINNNRRQSTSERNSGSQRPNSSSLFAALATNTSLQGELAQEDGRETMELSSSNMARMRSETFLGADSALVPRTLSPEGKIPVSSLALSSPPSYWEAAVKYQGWPQIYPRPEQGQEALPRYTCSVFREGCLNRKTELVGNWRPYRRPWKRTFAHLRGTALRLYAVDMEDVPRLHVRNISLQLAKCEMANDYKQRPNVIRIQACDRTILLECKDKIDALTWLEHLQAAANISTSLEDRSMPKFFTLPRAPNHPAAHSGSSSNASSNSTASNRHRTSTGSSYHQQQQQQQQEQQSSSMEQQYVQVLPTRQQQLQQQLQEQQEHILQQQRYEQRMQRAQQLVVQSSHSASSALSPTPSRANLSSSVTPAASSLSRTTMSSYGHHGQRNNEFGDHARPRRTMSSLLMTKAERQRTMTEADHRRESAVRLEDVAVMRSVLHALGQSTDSGSSFVGSDRDNDNNEGEDDEGDGGSGSGTDIDVVEPRRLRAVTGGVSSNSDRNNGQEWGRSRRSSISRSLLQSNPLRIRVCQTQQQEQRPQQGKQRAGWNRRLFGGLWSHQQQHHQPSQQHGSHPGGDGHSHQEPPSSQPLTAYT